MKRFGKYYLTLPQWKTVLLVLIYKEAEGEVTNKKRAWIVSGGSKWGDQILQRKMDVFVFGGSIGETFLPNIIVSSQSEDAFRPGVWGDIEHRHTSHYTLHTTTARACLNLREHSGCCCCNTFISLWFTERVLLTRKDTGSARTVHFFGTTFIYIINTRLHYLTPTTHYLADEFSTSTSSSTIYYTKHVRTWTINFLHFITFGSRS